MNGPFIDLDSIPAISPIAGIRAKVPHGQHLMLSNLEMDAGAEVPAHQHPHEQAGIILAGRLQLTIADETRILEVGQMYIVPPDTVHRAVAIDGPVKVLDIFSPIREDYAAMAAAGG